MLIRLTARSLVLLHLLARRIHKHPDLHSCQVHAELVDQGALDPSRKPRLWILRNMVYALRVNPVNNDLWVALPCLTVVEIPDIVRAWSWRLHVSEISWRSKLVIGGPLPQPLCGGLMQTWSVGVRDYWIQHRTVAVCSLSCSTNSVCTSYLSFGRCHIQMGMLACRLDIRVRFNIPLTILSAVVAVAFTFAAFWTAYLSETIENPHVTLLVSQAYKAVRACIYSRCPERDPEAAYEALQQDGEGHHDDPCPRTSQDWTEEEWDVGENMEPGPCQRSQTPLRRLSCDEHDTSSTTSSSSTRSDSSEHMRQHVASGSGSTFSGTTLASTASLSGTSHPSWDESLHAGLSRETRLRLTAQAQERPPPMFDWRYWAKTHWKTVTRLLALRAAVWGMALVLMHYCGMWAMHIPGGHISWNPGIVVLSYGVAFAMCLVACIFMEHMDMHFGRQVAFSTIAAFGCCSMHYTGMAAATFYTSSPPGPPEAGYPQYLHSTIIGIAVCVCVVSNVVLAQNAITARNRMAEMILTKRRLWRIMAEKEAAERANEVKQQFISVASHEIRTPMHTVNGYCELLARTPLTEEQTVYIASIQQACHAINVIAGNVLDFSKLDRNNVEQSARPVLVQLRKVLEDLARIQSNVPGVDIIISVASDVPVTVYLDETYTFRVLMNKFCDKGYICVTVSMNGPGQLVFQVRDTGCGIPARFRSAIFEPFRQADTSLIRSREGTGLGLSIIKHLVQRMMGSVEVESTEGLGSTFTVKLPVAPPSCTNTPCSDDIPLLDLSEIPSTPTPKRICVVYSDPRTEALLVELWAQHGHITSRGIAAKSVAELVHTADAVWTDVGSVAVSPLLRALLSSKTPRPFPVYIAYNEQSDLAALEPEWSGARNAVLVKRPVVLHALRDLLESPESHMGVHVLKEQSKVRFAIPAQYAETLSPNETVLPRPAKSYVGPVEEIEMTVEPRNRRETVLLVEDNPVNQRLGCRLLEKLGYAVVTANHGQEALDAISRSTFYCCLMDCQMPVLDGFATTRKVRELESEGTLQGHLPIVALTANVTTDCESLCRQAGMDHFLPKPLVLADLEETLKSYGGPPPHCST
ncbi:hypothetical histidine kinase [Postia placenta Mad-698-R]|uniref:Histidine kinase n=1 Tax=Postia placenta MAD-698-R-SB12 TaxID=670580 RepID=A0A1X6NDY5_9APHY|nr:hypothetical protein POSPLADRAFT_1068255 [Postia placenta MAD-698-R-SB12]EED79627.1 hypothetical histidine kinase [Postia placenta Mad-698-R]OSX66855.1 hypothetical protein POSPLADRAFT_1068255 [Postia placenta MAD-698-R-SB12]